MNVRRFENISLNHILYEQNHKVTHALNDRCESSKKDQPFIAGIHSPGGVVTATSELTPVLPALPLDVGNTIVDTVSYSIKEATLVTPYESLLYN